MLLLFDPEAAAPQPRGPPHGATGPATPASPSPEGDLDAWKERLQAHGVAIEHEQAWPRGGRSLYFRDPAGNSLELATPRIWGLPGADAAGAPA